MARIEATQNDWIVEECPDGVEVVALQITCPRCFCEFWVPKDKWPGRVAMYGNTDRTGENFTRRSCPYCFCTSRIPNTVVIRTLDDPDLVIPQELAEGLEFMGLIYLRWQDSPSGPIYSPASGVGMDRVRRSIVWEPE